MESRPVHRESIHDSVLYADLMWLLRGAVLLAGLLIAFLATNTVRSAASEQYFLARHGVHGYAEVESVGKFRADNYAFLSIDGRKPTTTPVHPSASEVGQIIQVTYNPNDLLEIHRGWGFWDWRADIAVVIALPVDIIAGFIIFHSLFRKKRDQPPVEEKCM